MFVPSGYACCKESTVFEGRKLEAYDGKFYYTNLDKSMVETPLYVCKYSLIFTNIQFTCNTNMLTRDVVHNVQFLPFLS